MERIFFQAREPDADGLILSAEEAACAPPRPRRPLGRNHPRRALPIHPALRRLIDET